MNIDPQLWGPCGWKFLHYISLGYPKKPTLDQKRYYREFVESLPYVLPCHTCREHFKETLRHYDITKVLNSRKQLFEFFVDAHNRVNKKNNKPVYSYEQVYMNYEIKNKQSFNYILYIVIFTVIYGIYRYQK